MAEPLTFDDVPVRRPAAGVLSFDDVPRMAPSPAPAPGGLTFDDVPRLPTIGGQSAPAAPSAPARFDVVPPRAVPRVPDVAPPPRQVPPSMPPAPEGQGGRQAVGRAAGEMLSPDDLMSTGGETAPGVAGRVLRDVGTGIVEAPRQILGGARDAWQEAAEALESAATWAGDQTGLRPMAGFTGAKDAALPEVAAPESTTGGLIRGVAQFTAGFVPAAKVAQVGKAVTAAGQFARASVAGAAADATVFDPHERRLSNLVQEYPELRNPVAEYLAADPSDSEAEGRFKNAVEGLALGTLAEGLFRGVRVVRAARNARSAPPRPNEGGRAAEAGASAGVVAPDPGEAVPGAPGAVSGVSAPSVPGAAAGEAPTAAPAAAARVGEIGPGSSVRISDPAAGDVPAGPLDGRVGRVVEVDDTRAIVEVDGQQRVVGRALLSPMDDVPSAPAAGAAAGGEAAPAPGRGAGVAAVPGPETTTDYLGGLTPERLRALAQTADDDTRRMIRDELRNRGVDLPAVDDVTLPARDLSAAPLSVAENQRRGFASWQAARDDVVPAAMYRDELGAVAFDLKEAIRKLPDEVARSVGPRLVRAISMGEVRGRPASGTVKLRVGDAGDTVTLKVREVQGRETWTPTAIEMGGGKTLDLTPPSVQRASTDPRDLRSELTTDTGKRFAWRGPVDLLTWLRTRGGLWDEAGELRTIGLENRPRKIAPREGFLGPLVRGNVADRRAAQLGLPDAKPIKRPDSGMTLDEATRAAWEAGFFGTRAERPTIREFLELLDAANRADGIGSQVLTEETRSVVDEMLAARPAEVDEMAASMGLDISGMSDREAADYVYSELGRDDSPLSRGQVEGIAAPAGEAISGQARAALDQLSPRVAAPKVERAGNIRLNSLNTVEDIRKALTTAAEQNADFGGARRGVVKDEALSALADDLGMTVDTLNRRKVGQSFSAEELLAARRLLADSGENLVRLAKAARGGSDDALMAFNEAWTRHVAIQEQVSGATAEAGRALRSMRLQAASERQRLEAVREVINNRGGRDRIEDIADKVAALADNSGGMNQFARNAYRGNILDMLREYWINALLSGPTTHVVNITSNALTFLWSLPEDALASAIGRARSAAGMGAPERVFGNEAAARLFGIVEGVRDGFRAAGNAARTGEAWDNQFAKLEGGYGDAIPGRLGQVIRIPTRLLQVEDSFFKALAFRTELNAAAANKAAREGLKGDAFKRRVADLRANPDAEMLERAINQARVLTFTNPTGEVGNAISMLRRVPTMGWVLPFIKTPFNILRFAARRSVFAPMVKSFREDMAAGGARRDQALAQLVLGNAAALAAFSYAREGLITGGGPSDPRERQALYATGWQPYSIKIGANWYSYDRLDPLGLLIGSAADMAEVVDRAGEEDATELAAGLAMSMATTLRDKSYLRGLSDALNALDDPDRYAGRWLRNFAGSFVPNVIGQYTRASDPTLREVRTMADELKARTPGQSEALFPRRDIWGEPVNRAGGLFGDSAAARIFTPVRVSSGARDTLTQELIRLQAAPSKPNKSFQGVELTAAQYDRLQVIMGGLRRSVLQELMGASGNLPDYVKREMVVRALRKVDDKARDLFMAEHPEVLALAAQERAAATMGARRREPVKQ